MTPKSKSQIRRFLTQSREEFIEQLLTRMGNDCGKYWDGEKPQMRSLIMDHESALILIRQLLDEKPSPIQPGATTTYCASCGRMSESCNGC